MGTYLPTYIELMQSIFSTTGFLSFATQIITWIISKLYRPIGTGTGNDFVYEERIEDRPATRDRTPPLFDDQGVMLPMRQHRNREHRGGGRR